MVMGKFEQLKRDHLQARKDKNGTKTNVLGVLLGEVQTKMKDSTDGEDQLVESTAKKLYKSTEESLSHAELENVKEIFREDLSYIEPYLPETLSKVQIKEILDGTNIASLPNFGAKMGVAMKTLKGQAVDGNDVKEVVKENYM